MATKKKQEIELQSVTVTVNENDNPAVVEPMTVGGVGVSEVLNVPINALSEKLATFSPTVEVEMLRGDFYLEHATDGSAGFDVRAAIDEPIKLIRGGLSEMN